MYSSDIQSDYLIPHMEDMLKVYFDEVEQKNFDLLRETQCSYYDIMENQKSILKKQVVEDFYNKLINTLEQQFQHQFSYFIFQLLLKLSSIYKKFIFTKKNEWRQKKLTNLCMEYLLISNADQIPDDWMNPPEGFKESKVNDSLICRAQQGVILLEKLMDVFEPTETLSQINQLIEEYLAQDTIKHKFAALMALSFVIQQTEELAEEQGSNSHFVSKMNSYLESENCLLRYAACSCMINYAMYLLEGDENAGYMKCI